MARNNNYENASKTNFNPHHPKTTKKKKSASEAGKNKVMTCQASPLEKIFAKRSRAYKLKGYTEWLEKTSKKTVSRKR